ncbi:uncharacterized protein [Apostichopus japonicus]|uniref:uncharacterized protein n=1 Tax=Stichopus japonicus TaxID=307972 RepID=UPI003AB5BE55
MTVVTQYKLHKFLTNLAEKEDLDVFVASKWKQRLTIILGIVIGTVSFGLYGLFIGCFVGYTTGARFLQRKYKAFQLLQKMDESSKEELYNKAKLVLGNTDLKTLENLASQDEEAKEKMLNYLQRYLSDSIVNETKIKRKEIKDTSTV